MLRLSRACAPTSTAVTCRQRFPLATPAVASRGKNRSRPQCPPVACSGPHVEANATLAIVFLIVVVVVIVVFIIVIVVVVLLILLVVVTVVVIFVVISVCHHRRCCRRTCTVPTLCRRQRQLCCRHRRRGHRAVASPPSAPMSAYMYECTHTAVHVYGYVFRDFLVILGGDLHCPSGLRGSSEGHTLSLRKTSLLLRQWRGGQGGNVGGGAEY